MYSGSLISAIEFVMNAVEVDESGLKLSVMGASGVLSMTRGWPVAVEDLLPAVEPPQAATPRARTLTATILFRTVRFIA